MRACQFIAQGVNIGFPLNIYNMGGGGGEKAFELIENYCSLP